jgi:hypothetical protein
MKANRSALFLLFALTVTGGTAFAHHGNVAYDEDHLLALKQAKVTAFIWANPHSFIKFDVTDPQGNVVHWAAELGSPSANTMNGWSRDSIMPGDVITVYMHQSKAKTPVGRLTRIVTPDGKSLCDHGCVQGDKNQGY